MKIKDSKNTNTGSVNSAGGNVHIGDNYYKSIEYNELQDSIKQLEKLVDLTEGNEEKQSYLEKLREKKKQLGEFKQGVISLAEIFQKIEIDTERLKKAKQFFDYGKFKEARVILDTEKIGNDQQQLLQKKIELEEKSKQTEKDLTHNANEYLVLAKLTAINFELMNWFEKTLEYFELSLKSNRNKENLFYYAHFLQEHKRENEAVSLYEEALSIYKKLAGMESQNYSPNIAGISGNLANVYADLNEADKAIQHYRDTLEIWHNLESSQPQIYLPNLADSLNNTGAFYFKNSKFYEAKFYLSNALIIYRQLNDKSDNGKYKLSSALNNLGCLEVEPEKSMKCFDEALKIRRKLSSKCFFTYSFFLAETLINIFKQNKDEKLLKEALDVYRELVKTNPYRYYSSLAQALMELATLQLTKDEFGEAEISCANALAIYQQLAEKNPQTFLPDVADTLSNLAILRGRQNDFFKAEKSYQDALEIRKQLAIANPQSFLSHLVNIQLSMAFFYQRLKVDKAKSIQLIDEVFKTLLPYSKISETQKYIRRALNILDDWGIDGMAHLKKKEKMININSLNKNHIDINWNKNYIIV